MGVGAYMIDYVHWYA